MTQPRSVDPAKGESGRRNLKRLHVGDARSIHAARFVALLQDLEHNGRLFHPSGEFFEDQVLSGADVYVPYFNEFYIGRYRLFVTSPVPFEIDPKSGLLFPVDDLSAIEGAIISGLEDEDLCRQATERNKQLIHARMNRSHVGREIDEKLQMVVREHGSVSGRAAS